MHQKYKRSAELYEDLIKCCVADAMSEVRSTARTCYRMFSKTWPERSRRLFSSFDPVIQRLINDEDGSIHKRYASPSVRERGLQLSRVPSQTVVTNVPGYGTSAIVAMDKSSSVASGIVFSSGAGALSRMKPLEKGSERSLESMLQASKQKVSAIESLLRGVSLSGKQRNSSTHSTSLDLGVDSPSSCDPLVPAVIPSTNHLALQNAISVESNVATIARSSARNGLSSLSDAMNSHNLYAGDHTKYDNLASDSLSALSLSHSVRRPPERTLEGSTIERGIDHRFKKLQSMQVDKQYMDTPYKDSSVRDLHNNYVPNFQRPLLRKQVTARSSASRRSSFDDSQLQLGEISSYVEGPASLSDALTEGLSPSSDWMARVSAFNYLRSLLLQGPRGIQEVTQNFEKVMKLFFRHLDDPHHKVAQAALTTLAEVIPSCRKPFESYLERILPHVFSRLIDPKELVRQPCVANLEIVSKTYGIDSLLPALLRSLDEQRSPKAKLAVIEFANNSFDKHSPNADGYSNNGFLKLWLAKLSPFVTDKNTKLKEASISGIISIYMHFDSSAVLNFILSLSVEEQNSLRRALKQFTPRIEVDLVNLLQSKKERQRSKTYYEQTDAIGTSSDDGYNGASKKSQYPVRYSGGLLDMDSGRDWEPMQESVLADATIAHTSSEENRQQYHNLESGSDSEVLRPHSGDLRFSTEAVLDNIVSWNSQHGKDNSFTDHENSMATAQLNVTRIAGSDGSKEIQQTLGGESFNDVELFPNKPHSARCNADEDNGISVPQILHHICNSSDDKYSLNKLEALQKLVVVSTMKNSLWNKYFNQILTALLEVLDDNDSSIRELALSLIVEMLMHQKEAMEDSVEIIIEKLLHVTKDAVAKVSNEAHRCLTIMLAQYDKFRCLSVIVPLLVSDDEKTLVICINCLTKLVGRLSQEELMSQLPSFLPAIFDAFGNQSPDVRKSVVFCLVDIYILLGKAFLPYLEGLSSTQLRLVTIYANRISQARSGVAVDANHG
ncbi:hypothetical protein HPP92_027229 [Vanilla planifolia]|uniref:TOG domain-containing protein n=1 Tax=Vanilla planifolia TaxID=51239 RepID=A0A835U5M9_VANPL|nr:hypothetical protein HPP92_027229 [Vanilla planifolia]KAG0449593.1 hypothetical protein HPP92_027294 [Vanilla planifolia]